MKYKIKSKKEYHQTMVDVYEMMNKGESNLSSKELEKLAIMSEAAEKYENEVLGLSFQKQPENLIDMIERRMFEKKITQSVLADTIGQSKSKISEIMSGKRKPDLIFLKGIYQILGIDADFILTHC